MAEKEAASPPVSINQRLIAEQLQISVATVSKAFRNHPDVKPKTRAMVFEHAASLGYVASLGIRGGARARKERALKYVGVIFNNTAGPAETDFTGLGYLAGLSEAANLLDAMLIVHRFAGSSETLLDPARQPVAMRDGLLDGLVLIHEFDRPVLQYLAERYPCVSLTYFHHGLKMDLVDSNHSGAIAMLLDHLLSLGHRKIGFLGQRPDISYSQARFGSFAQVCSRYEMPIDPAQTLNVFSSVLDIDAQTAWVMERIKQGVTAWICATDFVGYEIIKRLQLLGVRVPQDVSFTGYDAMEPMFGLPQITTVRAPFKDMGAVSMDRLLHRFKRPSQPAMQCLVDCQFVAGQTAGPVPTRS